MINWNKGLETLFPQATKAHQSNQFIEAEKLYLQILGQYPSHIDSLHLLGICLSQQEKYEDALIYLEKAIKLNPNNPVFFNNFGETFRRMGNFQEAMKNYQKSINIAPDFPDPYYNYAIVLKETGNIEKAIEYYQKTIKINPNHANALYNLGNVFLEIGRFKSSIEMFEKAVRINFNNPQYHNNLAVALKEFDLLNEAINHYNFALFFDPKNIEASRNLAIIYESIGKTEDAKKHYKTISSLKPDDKLLAFHSEIISPVIFFSNFQIDQYRKNLSDAIDKYAEEGISVSLNSLHEQDITPPSNLIYQGRDDKLIKEKFANLYKNQFKIEKIITNNSKPHIGFVVTNAHEGVFIKCMRGILNKLSNDDFKITVVCSLPNGEKIIRPEVTNPGVNYLNMPQKFDQAVDIIRQNHFDILYYWEIGTDSTNYFLPFCKPARIQMTGVGWPVTSAIPEVDYFVSCESIETPESDEHYTEKLIRLKHLPVYYYRPPVSEVLMPREKFGLSADQNVYLCSQNLRKVHPDFDRLAAEVLRKDANGIILFINDKSENISQQLQFRLQALFPDVASRIKFMTRMPQEEYLNLVANTDVILDTLYYSGGINTTYDAFACGTPIVTLPSEYHRGRYTSAAYKQIGISECIAKSEKDYVDIAVKIGTNVEYRNEIKNKIIEKCNILFEDNTVIEELSELFKRVLKGKG